MIRNFLYQSHLIILCLVVLNSLYAQPPSFLNAVVIQNQNDELPGDSTGYTAPCFGDWDGDGDNDLLIGTFYGGPIYHFENTAEHGEPVLELVGHLNADNLEIHVPYE